MSREDKFIKNVKNKYKGKELVIKYRSYRDV